MTGSALSQLLEMGIPLGRAKAALSKAKGDAMSAAEKVFGGEFDDIPSEDDGDDVPICNGHGSFSSSHGLVSALEGNMDTIKWSEEEIVEEDGAEEDVFFEAETEHRLMSDPYAGVFFSKDRIEIIIESQPDPRYVEAQVPEGGFGAPSRVRTLSRGEWMSGCPEEGEQSHLFQLYHLLEEDVPCPSRCDYTFLRSPDDFLLLFPDFTAYTDRLRTIIRPECPTCATKICLACGEAIDDKSLKQSSVSGRDARHARHGGSYLGHDELLHCLPIQGILIGLGLNMIEKAFATPNGPSVEKDIVINAKKRKTTSLLKPWKESPGGAYETVSDDENGDTYWGRSNGTSGRGTGYAGSSCEDRSGQLAAERAQISQDKQAAKLLSQIRVYLPNVNRPDGVRTSDVLVHPTALAHLRRRSAFVHDMLRNDSLLDMSDRSALYKEIFDWLEAVSTHESLASMLAMPQMRPTSTVEDPNDPQQRLVTYEGCASPRELLESCVIQATAALKGLKALSDSVIKSELREAATAQPCETEVHSSSQENDQLKAFCERILRSAESIDRSLVETKGRAFVERMKATLPSLDAAKDVQKGDLLDKDDEALVKIYEDWAARARFQYCDMTCGKDKSGSTMYQHAFNTQLRSLERMDAPKRSLAIAKELAILTRNLPVAWHSSIFLRSDETRVDCLKAMIIGPEGTPYENGCFIFDIFLPLDYNFSCPAVKSMTTNGGKYRYNPNLYADGKVCLSLLGTWQGPGWMSGQSTLLQVLISIQSLILCEEPYLNEPAFGAEGGSSPSKAYSANVRRMVMLDAMVNNIRDPPRPFEREIETHFRLKAGYIRKQIARWKLLDDGGATQGAGARYAVPTTSVGSMLGIGAGQTDFEKAADAVEKALRDLEEEG